MKNEKYEFTGETKQWLGYDTESDFIDWYEDNIEMIIDKYQEEYPEVVVNNGDPNDYLDFDHVMDWAREYYTRCKNEFRN